jgi:glycerophosphoryl diester phosphodiesterase
VKYRTRISSVALGLLIGLIAAVVAPAPTSAQVPESWLERRILNIAHQGGEIEAPSNTMYAFKTAAAKGADVLELDVHATQDRELVVIHDATVDRTTNGTGSIDEITLEQVRQLDAAYWFVSGCGTCHGEPEKRYDFRGIATGDRKMPGRLRGFSPSDFKIPTLAEVLETFPNHMINIEIKATAPETKPYEEELAQLLDEFGRSNDTIVVSFYDHAVERFKTFSSNVSTATGTAETAAFWASTFGELPGAPNPRYQALQVPTVFNGIEVVSQDFVEDAHSNDLAVHVWTINDRATMEWLIEIGVDGIMTDRPRLLQRVLVTLDVTFD